MIPVPWTYWPTKRPVKLDGGPSGPQSNAWTAGGVCADEDDARFLQDLLNAVEGPGMLCCQVNRGKSNAPLPCLKSGNRSLPRGRRLGAKSAKSGSADQMALDVERIVDRRVDGEESLG